MSADRVLSEMAGLGLEAMEFGPLGFLPEDAAGRREVLARHNLKAVGGFFPVVLHKASIDPLPIIRKELVAYEAAGAEVLVIAAETGQEGYDSKRPEMSDDSWATLCQNLTRISALAAERGIRAVIHPHVGTMVETKADVEEVLSRSDINFCLDTGHMWIGGTDPVEFAREHGKRVGHVHFKDVRLDKAQAVRDGISSYYAAVSDGLYTPLGDGDVDVRGIIEVLLNQGYEGWFVLEQDNVVRKEPSAGEGPMTDARKSVKFLQDAAGKVSH